MKLTEEQKKQKKGIRRAAELEAWKIYQAGMAEAFRRMVETSNKITKHDKK